jgi:putative nucleotidyltransferase with HDIG domain
LTGHTELETALRSIPIAHNFLNKPCEASLIKEVIMRAVNLQELLTDEKLKQRIDTMNGLPAMPGTYARLSRALENTEVTVEEIVDIIEYDAAISSRILRTVNSGFFGRPQRISEIKSAISFIGFKLLKILVLSVEVFGKNTFKNLPSNYSVLEEQQHAIFVANIASRIAVDFADVHDAFMAGLLHDIGKLVIASEMPDHYRQIRRKMDDEGLSFYSAEVKLNYSLKHTEIGAYLPNLWGFPCPVIEAIAHHHQPWLLEEQSQLGLPGILYIANVLAHRYEDASSCLGAMPNEDFNLEYLTKKSGIVDRLPDWHGIAESLANEVAAIT